MGSKGKRDETADKAISRAKRDVIPMIIRYESERRSGTYGDEYSVTVLSKMIDSKVGASDEEVIAVFTFDEEDLRNTRFVKTEPPYDIMTFGTADRFYLVNMLGKSRNRADELKKKIHEYLQISFGKSTYANDRNTYASVVDKLRTEHFIKMFRIIARSEALRSMAIKPPAW